MASNDNQKVALITGANRGVGFAVARQLAQQGIQVLLGSRDEERGRKAVEELASEGFPVSLIHIDVTNQSLIDAAVIDVTNKYGRLDILINNCGIYINEPRPSQLTVDTIQEHFQVNFLGAFAMTKAFLPLIRKSPSGRIVNVSSGLGSFSFHQTRDHCYFHLAYSVSKVSLNMFTYQLAQELKKTNIKVNACTPGLTATQLTNFHGHSVNEGAKSTIFLATLPDDGPTGKYFNEYCQEDNW